MLASKPNASLSEFYLFNTFQSLLDALGVVPSEKFSKDDFLKWEWNREGAWVEWTLELYPDRAEGPVVTHRSTPMHPTDAFASILCRLFGHRYYVRHVECRTDAEDINPGFLVWRLGFLDCGRCGDRVQTHRYQNAPIAVLGIRPPYRHPYSFYTDLVMFRSPSQNPLSPTGEYEDFEKADYAKYEAESASTRKRGKNEVRRFERNV